MTNKCTTLNTTDTEVAAQNSQTEANTLLATVITQSGAFTSGTLAVGQWGADIASGGTMYYRATEGIFTLTSSLTLSG